MELKSKHKDRLLRIILSCDSFATGYYSFALLFFATYAARNCNIYAVAFLPLAFLTAFAVMPVLYTLIHRFSPLLFGRYHLAMPLSALASTVFYVLMWSASDGSSAADACSMYFGALFFLLSSMLYCYCAFSVRARLVGDNISAPSPYSLCFSAFGAVAALAAMTGFYRYDSATSYVNTAYVLSAVGLLFAVAHYLATYCGIPRLGGKRNVTVSGTFRTFYGGINKRTFFSSLLFQSAFLTSAAFSVYIGAAFVSAKAAFVSAAVFIAAYAAAAFFCSRRVQRRGKELSVAAAICLVLSAAASILEVAIEFDAGEVYPIVLVSIAAALAGVGGAVAMRQTRLRFITLNSRITSGIVYILLQLTAVAAAAITLTVCVAVFSMQAHTATAYAPVIGPSAVAAFAIAAFALARKKPTKNDAVPELSYELNTEDDGANRNGDALSDTRDGAQR